MDHAHVAAIFAVALFAGLVALLDLGRRIGIRQLARDPEGARAGVGPIDGAIFGLLGLLIAFTFSGAATRFDWRRDLIVQEANDIGTAYLRLDLLPAETQPQLREQFRHYVDTRVEVYRRLPDVTAALEALAQANQLQGEIWATAVAACRTANSPSTTSLMLTALNAMIDITTTRTMAARTHPPAIVFVMLGAIALVSALLAGNGMAGSQARNWVHVLAFAAILGITVYVILDMEYPRAGFIRVDAFDQTLVDLGDTMR